ncbi:hypothetical protein TrVFT333_005656 [Trichoderma virens FT-333]|nr:hypothetical protein TrVFT333_005656 [Trichoderma virens FT-333]
MPRQLTNFSGACAHCRSKKLKCDRNARVCANCDRAKTPCIEIDPISGEQYERGYIEDLKARAAYLRAAYFQAKANSPYSQAVPPNVSTPVELQGHGISPNVKSIAGSSSKATGTPRFTDGSIFSLGHLVAAALSMHFPQGMGFQAGSLLQPQTDGIEISLSDEDNLPPLSVACDLTDA